MLRIFLETGIGFLIILFILHKDPEPSLPTGSRRNEKNGKRYFFGISGLLAVFAFLLFYKADEIPIPYHVDEAGMIYDALSLSRYGVDRYLYKNPVYFINFGGGQNALYTYLAAGCIKVFSYSVLSVRLPAILLSLISAVCLVRTIHKEHGKLYALITMGLFCILPFSIMHSRWGLESYLLFPMCILSCSALYAAIRSGKTILFAASGILLGLTLYSYAISYIFLVLFLFFLLSGLLVIKKIRRDQLLSLAIPLFVLALPLMLLLAVNHGLIDEIRTSFISIPKLPLFRSGEFSVHHIIEKLKFDKQNLFYNLFCFDTFIYNANPKYGTLFHFSIPLIILGAWFSFRSAINHFREKAFSLDFIMVCLFLSGLLTSLILDHVNINRMCELFIPLIYFLCIGVACIFRRSRPCFAITGVIYCILFVFFIRYYFIFFQDDLNKNSVYFSPIADLEESLTFVSSLERNEAWDGNIYIIGKSEPHIAAMLALDVDPYSFQKETVMGPMDGQEGSHVVSYKNYRFMRYMLWSDIPHKNIYIFRDIHEIPWEIDASGFKYRQFNTMRVYYDPELFSIPE